MQLLGSFPLVASRHGSALASVNVCLWSTQVCCCLSNVCGHVADERAGCEYLVPGGQGRFQCHIGSYSNLESVTE